MHRKMALALVQTPVDLSCQTAHGHLVSLPPPPPSVRRSPFTRSRHIEEPDDNRCSLYEPPKQCNGFVKVPCSCSSNNPVVTDDESSIPTPPPSVYHRTQECPVHCQRTYVTVHSPAYPPQRRKRVDDRDMPDITAFQCRQFSTDSDTSSYAKARIIEQVRTICYQCHGAGHVSVPVVPERCRPLVYSGSLPRDLTASTICGVESPEDEECGDESFQQRRRHSSGTAFHGSMRRITAV